MLFGACLSFAGCAVPESDLSLPEADPAGFEFTVYPILLADCGFPACHGNPDRFFAVYGPGRTRLSPETGPYDPATAEEIALSYTRARSMLLAEDGPSAALLLRKPLAVEAGGAGHAGDDPWGGPIFRTKRDPRYQALFYWAVGSTAGEP
ncbi:MAG: hypothetical protein IPK82_38520 [Polyangiaceae bacterium]|nr:hypothetical protein [Polyangiaceae bacterium]